MYLKIKVSHSEFFEKNGLNFKVVIGTKTQSIQSFNVFYQIKILSIIRQTV